jgi:hypothetical protein
MELWAPPLEGERLSSRLGQEAVAATAATAGSRGFRRQQQRHQRMGLQGRRRMDQDDGSGKSSGKAMLGDGMEDGGADAAGYLAGTSDASLMSLPSTAAAAAYAIAESRAKSHQDAFKVTHT